MSSVLKIHLSSYAPLHCKDPDQMIKSTHCEPII